MAGEDFGEFARADQNRIQSLIFWVGGRPQAELDKAAREGTTLHGLHSPFWAPEADKVIAAGAEALASAAIELMPKGGAQSN
jgi:hippurate hydrolase